MSQTPLGPAAGLAAAVEHLARTIDARAGGDPEASWTARLLAGGPVLAAKKLGEEGVETALAIAGQTKADVAREAADLIYHLLVALRSRGVRLDQVADVLADRQARSGLAEKASRI